MAVCLLFKTVVSSYWSNNTFKMFRMERKTFKEYSEAALEKEELYAMKSCFKELHTFLSMGGGGGWGGSRGEGEGVKGGIF